MTMANMVSSSLFLLSCCSKDDVIARVSSLCCQSHQFGMRLCVFKGVVAWVALCIRIILACPSSLLWIQLRTCINLAVITTLCTKSGFFNPREIVFLFLHEKAHLPILNEMCVTQF